MLNFVSIQEFTTRNARKMKYYAITDNTGKTLQLTKSIDGKFYLDGVEVTDPVDLKDIQDTLNTLPYVRNYKR